jgi:2,3-bisphosphoglycerate-independent phosphoglycerate mutase
VRIDLAVQTGAIATRPAVVAALARAKAGNGRLHLLGLVSDGGVHSHMRHLLALLAAAQAAAVPSTYIHFFGDGRDTGPSTAGTYGSDPVRVHVGRHIHGALARARCPWSSRPKSVCAY